jgi:hypothetical protein
MKPVMDRRTFLVAGGLGLSGWGGLPGAHRVLQAASDAGSSSPTAGKAKSTILVFLGGGASHIDMWDLKPQAPTEYRGPFQPIATSAPGVTLCEHLPMLARQAHHLAVINSVGATVNTNDHHAGYYYNLTGHVPDVTFRTQGNDRKPDVTDWPFIGSTVAFKRPPHPFLPSVITLPYKPGAPRHTRPGQFAGRLGLEYDPLYVLGNRDKPLQFTTPALELQGEVSVDRLLSRHELLKSLDENQRLIERSRTVGDYTKHQQKAFSLLCAPETKTAFDIASEPERLQKRYGRNINGMSMLMARRLVEAGVPFVSVFWKGDKKLGEKFKCASGGGWDTHANNFVCLKEHLLPEFDRAFSALLDDLAERGLLEETSVMLTSEMGRQPKIGDPRSNGVSGAGRDHWTHCLTDLLAGGGIRGGQTYGSSDKRAEYPADKPLTPADVTKTVYHAMGINDLEARDAQGKPFRLLEEGSPIYDLF